MGRYQRQDRFFKKAKKDNFVARSIYKLEEIDQRFSLIKKGQHLLDLGSAPGSWLQYLANKIGKKGHVLGIDLVALELSLGPNVTFEIGDIRELDLAQVNEKLELPQGAYGLDGVLSDMAPKLTGIRDADQARSIELADLAFRTSCRLNKPGAFFVAKFFQGRDTDDFLLAVKNAYRRVKLLKPAATREGSREVFVIAQDKKNAPK